jgi:hypothetical protein
MRAGPVLMPASARANSHRVTKTATAEGGDGADRSATNVFSPRRDLRDGNTADVK